MSCKMSVLKTVADMAGWTIAMAIGSRVMLNIIVLMNSRYSCSDILLKCEFSYHNIWVQGTLQRD